MLKKKKKDTERLRLPSQLRTLIFSILSTSELANTKEVQNKDSRATSHEPADTNNETTSDEETSHTTRTLSSCSIPPRLDIDLGELNLRGNGQLEAPPTENETDKQEMQCLKY